MAIWNTLSNGTYTPPWNAGSSDSAALAVRVGSGAPGAAVHPTAASSGTRIFVIMRASVCMPRTRLQPAKSCTYARFARSRGSGTPTRARRSVQLDDERDQLLEVDRRRASALVRSGNFDSDPSLSRVAQAAGVWQIAVSANLREPAKKIDGPVTVRNTPNSLTSSFPQVHMRYLTLIAVLFVASRSAAQPGARPKIAEQGPCAVTIVRAPDAVRREIERWISQELACRVALDVRVIPTEGGLYLLARDSTGLLHERLVPDAQAAGVLVASWVADDVLDPPSPPPRPVLMEIEPEPASDPMLMRTRAPRAPAEPTRWGLGLMVFPGDVSGPRIRGTLDVLHRGGLAAELILSGAYSSYEKYMAYRRFDSRALLGLSYTAGIGVWGVRLRGAVGAVWSHAIRTWGTPSGDWLAIPFEGSVTLSFHMSPTWSVGLAPIVTVYTSPSLDESSAALGTDLGVLVELRRGP